MCGIAGLAGRWEPAWLHAMTAALAPRGPDGSGVHEDPVHGVGFGARRLAILDLPGGSQPMASADGQLRVVFNGEIFNAPELRRQLEACGRRFASTGSDTEVLLHLYAERGEAMVDALNGMFAFVIHDRARGRLFGARDRFGIKPFYYLRQPGLFAFASELKSLLQLPPVSRTVDRDSLFHYMSLKYVPGERSILEGIARLAPAHAFTYDLEAQAFATRRYWRLAPRPDASVDEREWPARLREGVEAAIRRWCLSDVPIACSLSGGLDSAALVGVLAQAGGRVRTYTLGFDGAGEAAFSELALAREVARRHGTDHHELVLRPDALLQDLRRMVFALDEPYGGGLPAWHVFGFMAKDVKVALTGTGGDELFGNYGKFRWLESHPVLGALRPPRRAPALRGPRSRSRFGRDYFDRFTYAADEVKRRRVFDSWAEAAGGTEEWLRQRYDEPDAPTVRDRVAQLDIETQLVDEFLLMTDRFSMAHGLEARVPYLDHEFVELVFRVPAALRTRPGELKRLFKQAVRDLVPAPLLSARKRGFIVPLAAWLRGPLRPLAEDVLEPGRLARQGLFRTDFARTFLEPHVEGRADYADVIWTAVMFQLWHEQFIEAGAAPVLEAAHAG